MFDNYPPGAANDPNAPWNQKDPEFIECDYCDGTGLAFDDEYGKEECRHCNGEGMVEVDGD
jgi:DnaJ-class molecular chaperone